MKHNRILPIALVGSFVLLTVACVEEFSSKEEMYRPAGTPIVFSAAIGYQNGFDTRAEYSGVFEGNLNATTPVYERIDWKAQDKIRIVHNGTASNYVVSTVTASGRDSYAELTAGDLTWDGRDGHVFYGLYPSDGTTAATGSLSTNGYVTGTIPATQDVDSDNTLAATEGTTAYTKYQPNTAQYGYLVAYAEIAAGSGDTEVKLPFRPAFTTFEFRLQRTDTPDPAITSFELCTVEVTVDGSTVHTPLTGSFGLQIDGGDSYGATWNTSGTTPPQITSGTEGYSVTVGGFGTNGVHVPSDSYLDFSVLALPIDIRGVRLIIHYASGETKHLDFKKNNDWYKFTGAKKYVITNTAVPGGEYEYVIEEVDDIVKYGHDPVPAEGYIVKSYRYNKLTGDSVKEEVKWKTQYYDETNSTWVDMTTAGVHPDGTSASTIFTISTLTGDGVDTDSYATGESSSAAIAGTSSSTTYGGGADDAARAILQGAPQRGEPVNTGDGPFDLSRHPSYNIDRVVSQTTANSYIVSAPGYYMFPCVYGNAITNGKDNKSAYWPSSSDAPVTGESFSTLAGVQTNKNTNSNYWVYYTPRFYNALNNEIKSPYIFTDLAVTSSSANACVVWQDTPAGSEIIPYPASGTTPTNIGLTNVDGVDYIWFYIDREKIQPGNIVIALRCPAIVWSWHIWVTEKDLTPSSDDVVHNDAGDYTLMPYNLGWVDTAAGSVTVYDNRSVRYRLIQVDDSNAPIPEGDNEEFYVTQIGDSSSDGTSIGNNPYYQWGRKDPLIPAISTTNSKIVSPNPEYASYIVPGQNATALQITGTPSPNYGPGILNPYTPYMNFFDGVHGTTGWVGGTAYPFCTSAGTGWYPNRLFTQALTLTEALVCNDYGLTNSSCWRPVLRPGGDPNNSNDYDYYFDHYLGNTLSNDQYYNIWARIASILPTDFDSVGGTYPTALARSKSSAAMNLWNSYAYQEDIPNCDDNKFKTVYDPCPPGFTVPTKKVFLANTMPGQMARPNSSHLTSAKFVSSSMSSPTLVSYVVPAGLSFGSIFFPFTGDRVYSGGQLKPEGFGTSGLYWTDSPFQIDWANYGSSLAEINRTADSINAFSFYHSAYMFYFTDNSSHVVQAFTRGSACSIRPMVDPKYSNN